MKRFVYKKIESDGIVSTEQIHEGYICWSGDEPLIDVETEIKLLISTLNEVYR